STQLVVDYFDPFNCECRAYARLNAEGRQGLAVHAHGHLILTPQQEVEITGRTSCTNSDASDDGGDPWGRMEDHYGVPVRAPSVAGIHILGKFATAETAGG
ncbi:hypothetical protein C8A00DRAFT_15206, partial [Chaetomidium leptoderma]